MSTQETKVEEKIEETIYRTGDIPIKISYCRNCGKVCAEGGSGLVPKFCSLDCRQVWYKTWDKDWLIGDGERREFIESLRLTGYRDKTKITEIVDKLVSAAKPTVQPAEDFPRTVWAFFGMIRDLDADINKSIDDGYLIVFAGLQKILEIKLYLAEELWPAIYDYNSAVSGTAIRLFSKHPNYLKEINRHDFRLRELLKHENEVIQLWAIRSLSKSNEFQSLSDFLKNEKNSIAINTLIMDEYEKKGIAIQNYIEIAQKNSFPGIRIRATDLLNSLGINTIESSVYEKEVKCPNCDTSQIIEIPTTDNFRYITKNNLFFLGDIKIACINKFNCKRKFGIKLRKNVNRTEVVSKKLLNNVNLYEQGRKSVHVKLMKDLEELDTTDDDSGKS